jgi:hypothetical protein
MKEIVCYSYDKSIKGNKFSYTKRMRVAAAFEESLFFMIYEFSSFSRLHLMPYRFMFTSYMNKKFFYECAKFISIRIFYSIRYAIFINKKGEMRGGKKSE